ncbi:MAG: sugar ABC transporter permease [Treponema sp.]|nr:sugar ABC transporter permease [Treponema sp.]
MLQGTWLDRNLRWVFPLPAVIAILVLVVGPVLTNLLFSLQSRSWGIFPVPHFIGFGNYLSAFKDSRFWSAVGEMLYFTAIAVPVETLLGLAVALLLNQDFFLKGVVRSLVLLPMIATPVAVALIWGLMMNPELGVLNYFLQLLGLPRILWDTSPTLVIPSVALVDVWEWTPFMALIMLAALQSLSQEQLEAATIDGANWWQRLVRIIIPMIRPAIVVAVILRTIDALKTFDIIYVMTQGGPGTASETLNIYAFKSSFLYLRIGYAASLLVVLAVIVLGIAAFFNIWTRGERK